MNLFLFFIILLLAGFFGFAKANENPLIINEIMYTPIENTNGEKLQWVEMLATQDIPLKLKSNKQIENFYLCTKKYKATDECTSVAIYSPQNITTIHKNDFVLFLSDPSLFDNVSFSENVIVLKATSLQLLLDDSSKNYALVSYRLDNKNSWQNEVFYRTFDKTSAGHSLELIKPEKNDWQESYILSGTPGYENFTGDDIEPEPIVYSDQIIVSEILPDPAGSDTDGEFIELHNSGDQEEELINWKLQNRTGQTYVFSESIKISANGYLKLGYATSKITLHNTGGEIITLYNPAQELASTAEFSDNSEENLSYSIDANGNWLWTKPTPNAENEFTSAPETPAEDPISENKSRCDGDVCLNEILPNPKGEEKEKEFVEIFNSGDADIDIGGWTLKDKSSTKYAFPDDTKIKPKDFLTIYRKDFKFAMNNSGPETIYLKNKDGKIVSSVFHDKTKENVSYNFDGALWHWSKKLTPGKVNKFNRAPKIKIEKIKNAYAGMPVAFKASVKDKDKDKLKYTWDFGDKHKSYLKNTTHSFLKKGTYHIILTVDDGSEKFAKTLSVKIKKYPKADVKIVQLAPNPAGDDTGNEEISLLNNSKKKINLKGWKIATGDKKMINHVIANDFLIEPGKIAGLTKKDASFYLTNTAMKLELRYPNGKTADKIAYTKDKIEEDEVYKKINNQWAWVTPSTESSLAIAETQTENILPVISQVAIAYDDAEVQANLGKYSTNPEWQKKKESKILLASAGSDLKITLPEPQGQVLGASTVREIENYYSFTSPTAPEKHWAVKIWENINSSLNSFLLKLS